MRLFCGLTSACAALIESGGHSHVQCSHQILQTVEQVVEMIERLSTQFVVETSFTPLLMCLWNSIGSVTCNTLDRTKQCPQLTIHKLNPPPYMNV